MMDQYASFLKSKAITAHSVGLSRVPDLAPHLFDFQVHAVHHALTVGRAGNFLDTGLGKTECQLEWSRHAMESTNGRGLILTPLAVAAQTKRRADRWGYDARVIREQSEAGEGINICNYDRLGKLDPEYYGCVTLDEASILKSFTGKTTRALIDAFMGCRFKLAATATPAPNDHMEIGPYSEFLELMSSAEMLSRWFINDTSTASQQWRLKGHAERDFWDWMASWGRMAEKPSDLAGDDDGFILPPFEIRRHHAERVDAKSIEGDMFAGDVMSATNMHDVKRQTSEARAETAATLADPSEPMLFWCDTNYEADALKRAMPDAVEVRGSMTIDQKEERLEGFALGKFNHLIAKPSMCGFGLDWNHCARMVFVGRSFSYETWYQAVRRCWRFGQERNVIVDLIVAEGEDSIGRVIDRKAADHIKMKTSMRDAMVRAMGRAAGRNIEYNPTYDGSTPKWLKSVA